MVSAAFPFPYDCSCAWSIRLTDSGLATGIRLAFAATAALSTIEKDGLIPQARHGGSGNNSVAVVGSKFAGTGLEKEQMGHTQVPMITAAVAVETDAAWNGLAEREPGVEEDCSL